MFNTALKQHGDKKEHRQEEESSDSLVWVHEPMKFGQAFVLAHLSTCVKPTIKPGLGKH